MVLREEDVNVYHTLPKQKKVKNKQVHSLKNAVELNQPGSKTHYKYTELTNKFCTNPAEVISECILQNLGISNYYFSMICTVSASIKYMAYSTTAV